MIITPHFKHTVALKQNKKLVKARGVKHRLWGWARLCDTDAHAWSSGVHWPWLQRVRGRKLRHLWPAGQEAGGAATRLGQVQSSSPTVKKVTQSLHQGGVGGARAQGEIYLVYHWFKHLKEMKHLHSKKRRFKDEWNSWGPEISRCKTFLWSYFHNPDQSRFQLNIPHWTGVYRKKYRQCEKTTCDRSSILTHLGKGEEMEFFTIC